VFSLQVRSYDLFIDLEFERLKFEGRVLIALESETDVILNAVGLKINSVRGREKDFRFRQQGEYLVIETGPFTGTLEVDYAGSVSDSMVGIYRAPYAHTHIVTTDFEPAHARRMLPCVDRPDCKAEFRLSVRIDKELYAISNMPISSTQLQEGKKVVSFKPTPRMSTYLLYLGVGKFVEQGDKANRTGVIVATTPEKMGAGGFALKVAKKTIEFYESYFSIPYMLPKVHLILVPECAAGAMENWGAITFRETALLVDANSSIRTRRLVAEIVAHELAHQWFGNLVTMKWWNDVWLNESFATFMANKAIEQVYPEWGTWDNFLLTETGSAMARDCLKNTHPIEAQVNSPDEIAQIFDDISYGKGASILRMIEGYIGKDAFRDGLRRYLSKHAFSNATGSDLWASLQEASGDEVKTLMSKWIQQAGYPVVIAGLKDEELTLRQERFLISGRPDQEIWPIPVTMEIDGELKRIILEKEEKRLAAEGNKPLRINLDRTGFYSVHYNGLYDMLWRGTLSAFDRWGIISDAFAFLFSGHMRFNEYTAMLERYYREREYLPAREVSDQLSRLYAIMPTNVMEASTTFHRGQLELLERKFDERSAMLRGIVGSRLSLLGGESARELASKFEDYEQVEPDMKQAVAIAYATSVGDYDQLERKYRAGRSDEERIRFLTAMAAFQDESLLNRTLDFTLSGEVKKQDVRTVVLAATRNPKARDVTWNWLRTNIGRIRELYQGTSALSGTFLLTIPILGIGRMKEVEEFFRENKMVEAERGIMAGLEKLEVYDKLVKQINQ
jgi:tricorn protease interacting factor F2/3